MNIERPTQPDLAPTEEDLAALRQQYKANDVIECFRLLGLPVCDDPVIIRQVASREKAKYEQESLSATPTLRQQAVAWLNAYRLLGFFTSRRELLLILQEEVNNMLTFRLERHGQAGTLYAPDIHTDLKAAIIRGFALSDDLAERFLRSFEHGCTLRFGARIPDILRRFDARGIAEQTFAATLTALIPVVPKPEMPAPARPTKLPSTLPIPAVRPKPSVTKISAPAEQRSSGPLLTPGNALARLICTQDGQTTEWVLTKDSTSIGRLPDSDLCLTEDRRVSRQHAVIHRAPTAFLLTDLNSGNGTFLNGVLLTAPTVLHSGDQIRVGHTEFTFMMEPMTDRQNS